MRNDQIFVLLIVVLLPMSGCFDGAVGDAEGTDDTDSNTTVINNYYNQTTNIPPIFHIASIGFENPDDYGRISTYDPSTGEELTRMYHVTPQFWFSVTDSDSNITDVGIDLDLDLVLDYHFINNGSWGDLSFYAGPDIAQSNGSLANYGSGEWAHYEAYCYVRFNLMALDDEGGIQIIPYTLNVEGNEKLPHDADGCQADYSDFVEE